MLVICPECKPIDESKSVVPRVQAVGVGIPRRHFKKHLELVHGITDKT